MGSEGIDPSRPTETIRDLRAGQNVFSRYVLKRILIAVLLVICLAGGHVWQRNNAAKKAALIAEQEKTAKTEADRRERERRQAEEKAAADKLAAEKAKAGAAQLEAERVASLHRPLFADFIGKWNRLHNGTPQTSERTSPKGNIHSVYDEFSLEFGESKNGRLMIKSSEQNEKIQWQGGEMDGDFFRLETKYPPGERRSFSTMWNGHKFQSDDSSTEFSFQASYLPDKNYVVVIEHLKLSTTNYLDTTNIYCLDSTKTKLVQFTLTFDGPFYKSVKDLEPETILNVSQINDMRIEKVVQLDGKKREQAGGATNSGMPTYYVRSTSSASDTRKVPSLEEIRNGTNN